ncbi:hypothetical protein B0H10DRAFT_2223527 [Mycena sp. CBHHK59/15]|nr:hypothetical protein B0H10DRAFT_2223527 [Mycena sp. CBHHK59/15]
MSTTTVYAAQSEDDLSCSPVTFHFDASDLELSNPHSPASSVKGLFIRSRPNSMAISENESPFEQFGMTSNIQVPIMQPPPVAIISNATKQTPSVRTHATSATTTTVHPVRRDTVESGAQAADTDATVADTRRRTWPAMLHLRRRVSGIFNRKQSAARLPPNPPPTPADAAHTPAEDTTPPWSRRTFSLSMRSRASSIRSHQASASNAEPVEKVLARRRRVRRSRSFAGFTTMAQHVLASIEEPDHDETAELDEVSVEAYNTVRGIGKFWVYEEDESGAVCILERGVERR